MIFGLAVGLVLVGAPAAATPAVACCFPRAAELDEFRCRWYCNHLHAMAEQPLPLGAEGYRFLYLRTFHAPISVRVQRIGQRWLLSARLLDGHGGYGPGHVAKRTDKELSPEEARMLEDRLRTAAFWGNPWKEQQDTGVDGARWILEGRRGSEYRLVDIWSPQGAHYERFREACLYFLDLAKLRPTQDEIY